jgi:phosphate-selective porin OprO/OprP
MSFPNPATHKPAASRAAVLAAALAAGLSATPAAAQESADTALSALEEKVLILERTLEIKEEVEAAAKETAPKILVSYNDGFNFKSADDKFSLRQRTLLNIDYRGFFATNDSASQRTLQQRNLPNNFPSSFYVRKARPYFEATLDKWAFFRIVPEFGGGFQLLDAYAELTWRPGLRLRAGKFTPPLGLERIQSASDNLFAEYALTSNLHPSRDLGAQLLGEIGNETFGYALGVFNGAVDAANKEVDSTSHKDVDARVFVQPFKTGGIEALRNLGFGVAGSYGEKWGDSLNPNLPSFRSPGQNTLFAFNTGARDSLTVQAKGAQYRVIPQGYWYVGAFSLLGEYAFSAIDVNYGKRTGDAVTLYNSAWFAAASWVVTGEAPTWRSVRPRHPVGRKGIGAIEVAARVHQLIVDENAFDQGFANRNARVEKATAYGGGVNWYLNRFVRALVNYEYTGFEGGAAGGKDRDPEHVGIARLQINL